jgi:exodeoxyribonuclease-3
VRIATLNIRHGGGKRVCGLATFVNGLKADCLLLTEFRSNGPGFDLSLKLFDLGYAHQSEISDDPKLNQLRWFSKHPFTVVPLPSGWGSEGRSQQRIAAIQLGNVTLIGVYFPQGKLKSPVFDYLNSAFPSAALGKAMLIGDFNTGKHFEDEASRSFICAGKFEQMLETGWVDVWRSRNPTGREFSWFSNNGNGFRIDHALCTDALEQTVKGVSYLQESIATGLTDHACLTLDLVT